MNNVAIMCTAPCRYNDNSITGYCNACQHPIFENLVPYGGIDRYYVAKCEHYEKNVSEDAVDISLDAPLVIDENGIIKILFKGKKYES